MRNVISGFYCTLVEIPLTVVSPRTGRASTDRSRLGAVVSDNVAHAGRFTGRRRENRRLRRRPCLTLLADDTNVHAAGRHCRRRRASITTANRDGSSRARRRTCSRLSRNRRL